MRSLVISLLCTAIVLPAHATPTLGSAESFAVLGATAVRNSGPSEINGNLGVEPGTALSGFPPGTVTLGDVLRDNALTRAAQKDLATAFNQLAAQPCASLPVLGGNTLAPGVYCLPAAAELPGTLTLDAAGNSDALWIFKTNGTLTTAPESAVLTINGAQRGNVYWQIGQSATLGHDTTFVGNILANGDITLGTGAGVYGRALSRTGAVTLHTNVVSLCCDAIRLSPTLPISVSGGAPPYVFALVAGSLPPGLTLSPSGGISGVPATPGHYAFVIKVTDSRDCSRIRAYTIDACPTITVSELPETKIPACVPFSHPFSAGGGSGSYRFHSTGTLPPGLSLSEDGLLSEKPAIPGVYTFSVTAVDTVTGCTGTREVTLEVFCPQVPITPDVLPGGFVGKDYVQTIVAGGPCGPYTFSNTAPLPDGLTLSPAGVLSLTPRTTKGSISFTVTARDPVSTCSGEKTYTIDIDCPVMTIKPETLKNAEVGVLYDEPLSAEGGTGPYTIVLSDRGTLPNELDVMNAVKGVPLTAGIYRFTVEARDQYQCMATRVYELAVCPLSLSPSELPDAIAGMDYLQTIHASGGSGSYEFSVPPNTLPPGLVLNTPRPGDISGQPTQIGTFHFTITARDTVTNCRGSKPYTIHVVCPDLTISPSDLPPGIVGVIYEQTLVAGAGIAADFTLISGALPPGLGLCDGGTICGTPTAAGTFTAGVRATYAGCTGEITYCTFDISPGSCPAGTTITLSPSVLPPGATTIPYSQFITPAGGTGPYTFAVNAGALPPGLGLNPVTGEISVVPLAAGSYDFTITATDANGCIGSRCYTIAIDITMPALSGWGTLLLCALLMAMGLRRIHG